MLAALRCLSDDCSWFNRKIMPMGQKTDVEIRMMQFDLRYLVKSHCQSPFHFHD